MRLLLAVLLASASLSACAPVFAENGVLKIIFIDVGQGDSTLIILPNGKTMLVDGGERNQDQTVLSTLEENNIAKIDVMVATHPHADHIGGLIGVMNSVDVGQVIDSGQIHTTQTFQDFIEAIESNQIPLSSVRDGDSITLDPNVSMQVLNPPVTLFDGAHNEGEFNNNSVVLKLTYGEFTAMFPGDIELETESRLADTNIDVDVMLASHHGSRGSNTAQYLAAASPDVIVIYAGADNPYGHPHPESLDRIEATGVQHVLRTDIDSTTVLTTDGGSDYTLETAESDKVVVVPEFETAVLIASVSLISLVALMTGGRIWKSSRPV
jgi:beta-lactamase superfamily II metal-dependent hydrolase